MSDLGATLPQALLNARLDALVRQPPLPTLRQLAQAQGWTVWLVGGALRDALLGRPPGDDLDVVVQGVPVAQAAQQFAQVLQGRYLCLDAVNDHHRVVGFTNGQPAGWVDFAAPLQNNLATDLHRRDFTVNALAVALADGLDSFPGPAFTVVDPTGGLPDLANQQWRMVSEANLVADPLRLLRLPRFMAQWPDWSVDAATVEAVNRHSALLPQVAGERILQEVMKLLAVPKAFPAIQALADWGLLETLIPELRAVRTVPPNSHHHLPLWEHTLELLRLLDDWLPQLPATVQHTLAQPIGTGNQLALLRLGCLLHDIAKPQTWTLDTQTGQHRFLGHEKEGETLTETILQRWKVSAEMLRVVKKLVRWHLYPCQFGPQSARKSVLRFFRRMGEETPLVTVLALVDRLATRGPAISPTLLETSVANHLWLLEQYEQHKSVMQAPALLTGYDVMTALGWPPGPRIGRMLARLREQQDSGVLTSRQDALYWLQQQAPMNNSADGD